LRPVATLSLLLLVWAVVFTALHAVAWYFPLPVARLGALLHPQSSIALRAFDWLLLVGGIQAMFLYKQAYYSRSPFALFWLLPLLLLYLLYQLLAAHPALTVAMLDRLMCVCFAVYALVLLLWNVFRLPYTTNKLHLLSIQWSILWSTACCLYYNTDCNNALHAILMLCPGVEALVWGYDLVRSEKGLKPQKKTSKPKPVAATSLSPQVHQVSRNFEGRSHEYAARLQRWMVQKQPYLNPSFCLSDLTKVVPLNRTYLSKLCNQQFGKSFSTWVADYRLEYSKQLLSQQPQLTIKQVAAQSGFSSAPVFTRLFVQKMGITPAQFKKNLIETLPS